MPKTPPFLSVYASVALGRLIGEIWQIGWLQYLTTPLITISLGWYVVAGSPDWPNDAQKRAVVLGLASAGLGDLAFVVGGDHALALGLIAFLVTHLAYTLALVLPKPETGKATLLGQKPYLALPFLLYGGAVYLLLGPGLKFFWLPVLFYTALLPIMALAALNRLGRVEPTSFWLSLAGAVLFMLTGTVMGIDLFFNPAHSHTLSIMVVALYLLAQYLVVEGLRRHAVW
jgi:uncharacterized membrane protein YhhN